VEPCPRTLEGRGYTGGATPRGVAQLAEHRSPKPGVAGSSPAAPVLSKRKRGPSAARQVILGDQPRRVIPRGPSTTRTSKHVGDVGRLANRCSGAVRSSRGQGVPSVPPKLSSSDRARIEICVGERPLKCCRQGCTGASQRRTFVVAARPDLPRRVPSLRDGRGGSRRARRFRRQFPATSAPRTCLIVLAERPHSPAIFASSASDSILLSGAASSVSRISVRAVALRLSRRSSTTGTRTSTESVLPAEPTSADLA
jgi:hypothetical protein